MLLKHEQFHTISKAELHLHLGGSFPLDYLCSIATDAQKEELTQALSRIAGRQDYHEAFHVFKVISQIVDTDEKVEKGTIALCKALERDGVVYVEIRTGLKDLGSGFEGYLQSVLKGIQGGSSDRLHVRLLLSLQRASSLSVAQKTVDLALKYKEQGIVGIDLSGDSTLGQVETILPELKRAKDAGLFLTVHMGESAREVSQKQILEELQPHRIGHGVHLADDARDYILAHRIPIEVCPTSSVLVRMVDDFGDHPWLRYHAQGHPIIICTDDPLIFQNTLTGELTILNEKTSLSMDELKRIASGAIEHAFLSDDEKQFLMEKFFN